MEFPLNFPTVLLAIPTVIATRDHLQNKLCEKIQKTNR